MSAQGPGSDRDAVDQIVFRWQGNQGRRSAGLTAAAWSCPEEDAEELGQELAPFLRVDGAPCPSVVRTRLRDDRAALVQRWPTADPGGRPNTAAHVLVGPTGLLGPRTCLALRDWTWSGQEFAEQAHGGQPRLAMADLEATVVPAWADTLALLPDVRDTLTAATAALLRHPQCRLSLRSDALPGWPEQNRSGVVVAGLLQIFGLWLGRPWTFATHDMTDRHDLLATWVSDWSTDGGRQRARYRVDPRRPEDDRAHELAARLVGRCLAAVERGPGGAGLPELKDGLRDGASLPAEERLRRLARVLDTNRRPESRDPGEGPGDDGGSVYTEPRPPSAAPSPPEPPAPSPASGRLHAVLRNPRPDPAEAEELDGWIRRLTGREALLLLREEDLSYRATTELLCHLHRGRGHRNAEAAAALCTEVLRQRLYLFRAGPDQGGGSRADDGELSRRSVWVFAWAVSPYVREERHAAALDRWLTGLLVSSSALETELLRGLVPPPGGPSPEGLPPDLPPVLWQRLLHGLPPVAPVRAHTPPAPPPPSPPPRPAPPEEAAVEGPAEAPALPVPTRPEDPPPPQPPPAPAPAGPSLLPARGRRYPGKPDQGDDRDLIAIVLFFLLAALVAIGTIWIVRS
ncbi:hypothetical protein [Kitasatospora sp. NPDC058046]|uniref:hypothetical protein n=1 Tax=Kitasatospora sp. NPDC058046 TaxID=3346312 RepID=UPI0036DE09D3